MDKRSKMLYINATGRVFSPAEYSLGLGAYGEPTPRLCLEDTDFLLVPQHLPVSPSDAQAKHHLSIPVLVSIIAALILML